jgi:hypothetical protein
MPSSRTVRHEKAAGAVQSVELERFDFRHALACQRQQAAAQVCRLLSCLLDGGEILAGSSTDLFPEQRCVPEDDHEQVVEVVRDGCREQTEHLKLVRTPHLVHQHLALLERSDLFPIFLVELLKQLGVALQGSFEAAHQEHHRGDDPAGKDREGRRDADPVGEARLIEYPMRLREGWRGLLEKGDVIAVHQQNRREHQQAEQGEPRADAQRQERQRHGGGHEGDGQREAERGHAPAEGEPTCRREDPGASATAEGRERGKALQNDAEPERPKGVPIAAAQARDAFDGEEPRHQREHVHERPLKQQRAPLRHRFRSGRRRPPISCHHSPREGTLRESIPPENTDEGLGGGCSVISGRSSSLLASASDEYDSLAASTGTGALASRARQRIMSPRVGRSGAHHSARDAGAECTGLTSALAAKRPERMR